MDGIGRCCGTVIVVALIGVWVGIADQFLGMSSDHMWPVVICTLLVQQRKTGLGTGK